MLDGGDGVGKVSGVVRDLKHCRVYLLQGIHALLELNVIRRELGLSCGILTLRSIACDEPAGALQDVEFACWGRRTLSSTLPTCSLTYC